MNDLPSGRAPTPQSFLTGGGEIGALICDHDWAATPLGPPEGWPQSLKTAIRIMLSSRFAMWMLWGPELTFFCNDAYRPTLGVKEGWLGARSDQVWAEIWPDIGPRIEHVLKTGEATWDEALLLFLKRSGFTEETYHTFSYSPLADDRGVIAGMLCVVTEETERVIGERRLRVLRDLGIRLVDTRTSAEVWAAVEACVATEASDLPFALAYLADDNSERLHLASASGIPPGHQAAPLDLDPVPEAIWPATDIRRGATEILIDGLYAKIDDLPPGPWEAPPGQALIVPIAAHGQARPVGALVAGLNPYRPLDATYRGFIHLFVGQIAAALANANAYNAERARAQAFADVDRAKTAFFSNVSHEFRTPLTLMLGPIEDALADAAGLPPEQRRRLDVAHRNRLRLLRLVNALLDFSRIEAGRVQASYRPTDLAALTADLASSFRSATDKAGLRLTVDCPPLSRPVYVDRDMWEKVVLNLVSNAFKFTFEGEIAVELREVGTAVRLTVRDTGVGIAAHELPYLFERFHRVEGAPGRSFEGSGIGLALVQELTRLHGGEVAVESTVNRGTAFSIDLPFGVAHLPAEHIDAGSPNASTAAPTQSFVEEALRWLPDGASQDVLFNEGGADDAPFSGVIPADSAERRRVLLAEDNADLRAYIARLLAERGYEVETAADGEAALATLRLFRADLLVTDLMMPRLDGLGLVRAIRNDPALRDLPVIMLSARAGEDAKIEGLDSGADGYLTKPFSARELLAHVAANLATARVRQEAAEAIRASEARLRELNADLERKVIERAQARGRSWQVSPDLMGALNSQAYFETSNPAWQTVLGWSENEVAGMSIFELLHPDDVERTREGFDLTQLGQPAIRFPNRYRCKDGSYRWISWVGIPEDGLVYCTGRDITAERDQADALAHAEEALRQAQKMEAVGQLTGGIAHDFNNMLAVVIGSLDLLRRRVGPGDPRAGRYIDAATDGARRAAQLTQRLLVFSRQQPLQPESIDANKLVTGMSELIRGSLGSDIRLETVLAGGHWRIHVDPNQLENALLNLAVNARDAMPDGGRLTIETRNTHLDDRSGAANLGVPTGQYVLIAVTDTGVGMPADVITKAFDPFFTTKEVGKGTGLGLSQVYGFVKQTGGHVKIYSEPSQGTTVKIYLPRLMTEGDDSAEDDPQAEMPLSERDEVVLVVEDEPAVRQFSVDALGELGYRVLEADGAASALRLLDAHAEIALLFTDIVMPDVNGRKLADEARRGRPELKVLFTTGYTRNAVVHNGVLDPGVELISKPFTIDELAAKVRQVLDAPAPGSGG